MLRRKGQSNCDDDGVDGRPMMMNEPKIEALSWEPQVQSEYRHSEPSPLRQVLVTLAFAFGALILIIIIAAFAVHFAEQKTGYRTYSWS